MEVKNSELSTMLTMIVAIVNFNNETFVTTVCRGSGPGNPWLKDKYNRNDSALFWKKRAVKLQLQF